MAKYLLQLHNHASRILISWVEVALAHLDNEVKIGRRLNETEMNTPMLINDKVTILDMTEVRIGIPGGAPLRLALDTHIATAFSRDHMDRTDRYRARYIGIRLSSLVFFLFAAYIAASTFIAFDLNPSNHLPSLQPIPNATLSGKVDACANGYACDAADVFDIRGHDAIEPSYSTIINREFLYNSHVSAQEDGWVPAASFSITTESVNCANLTIIRVDHSGAKPPIHGSFTDELVRSAVVLARPLAHVAAAYCSIMVFIAMGSSDTLPWGALLILILDSPLVTLAVPAFTHEARYRLDSIRQNSAGTFCFYPVAFVNKPSCLDSRLQMVLDVHVNNGLGSGLSIAYYSTEDGAILGGAGWSDWNTTYSPVVVCMSGAVDDLPNAFVSRCRFSTRDDDFDDPRAHAAECVVNLPQIRVTDGCYTTPAPAAKQHRLSAVEIFGIVTGGISLLPIAFGIYKWVDRRRRRATTINGAQDVELQERRVATEGLDGADMRNDASQPNDAPIPVSEH